jgi:hypothetical protein
MSTTPINHLYRSLLREIRLAVCRLLFVFPPTYSVRRGLQEANTQSLNPRSRRNLTVENGIRDMLVESKNPGSAQKLLMETRDFMRASRIHSVSIPSFQVWRAILRRTGE